MKNYIGFLCLVTFLSLSHSVLSISNSRITYQQFRKETDREKGLRLSKYVAIIEKAMDHFDKDTYNEYMALLKVDTGFHVYYKHHYEAYLVLKRCINEGEHIYDISDGEYGQMDSIAYLSTSSAGSFAKLYLIGYDAYKEDLDRKLSIELKENSNNDISIFPNPVKDEITLDFKNLELENPRYYITDLNGKLIKTDVLKGFVIDVSELQNGVYTLQVKSQEQLFIQKFIIEK